MDDRQARAWALRAAVEYHKSHRTVDFWAMADLFTAYVMSGAKPAAATAAAHAPLATGMD